MALTTDNSEFRSRVRQSGDRVASLLRQAARTAVKPDISDIGRGYAAAYAESARVGGDPMKAYTGSLETSGNQKREDQQTALNYEKVALDLDDALLQSQDRDSVALGEALRDYAPSDKAKIFESMAKDPTEYTAGNMLLGVQNHASRLGVEPLSYAEHKAKIQKIEQDGKQNPGGATGELVDRYMKATNASFPEALQAVQTGFRKNMLYGPDGTLQVIPGAAGAEGALAGGKEEGKQRGKLNVEREANKTKAQNALKSFEMQSKVVTDTIDKALANISAWSTGYGSWLDFMPNSGARKLKNDLDTIKANVGFDKLQQMRDNSPTGGALGQVSEMENRLLQAVNGALDPGQSDQLKENLETIKELYPQVLADRRQAYAADYEAQGQSPMAPIENMGKAHSNQAVPSNIPQEAKKAADGNYYIPDPDRPGKYLMVEP